MVRGFRKSTGSSMAAARKRELGTKEAVTRKVRKNSLMKSR